MRYFVDPALFCYEVSDWENRNFDRLERFLAFIVQIESIEEALSTARDWKFRFSDELMGDIYDVNPFKNEPDVSGHWQHIFAQRLLPSLSRRVIYCPDDEQCLGGGDDSEVPEVGNLPTQIGNHWKALLELCGSCGHHGDKVYVSYPPARSVHDVRPFFDEEIDLERDIKGQFPVELYFPQGVVGIHRQKNWKLALKYYRRRMIIEDQTWIRHRWRPFVLTDDFFKSLGRARFLEEGPTYFERILRVMNEVICGRSVVAHTHDMRPETFTFGNNSYTKMNAHVFQMGPDANDRRCSRIYFCIRRGGPWFMEYDPDAH